MRVSIDIVATPTGWMLSYTPSDGRLDLAPRALTRSAQGDGFPLPPEEESPRWTGKSHKNLCTGGDAPVVEKALKQILIGDADSESRRRFGNYVTAVLLGKHVDELTKLPDAEPIEIYIRTRSDDRVMQVLPWELMYADDEPFAAGEHNVAVVRVIASEGPRPKTTPLELPLKVLFVIGQTLDDAIRPGAEYMALLRRTTGTADDLRAVSIDSRLLLRATKEEIARAVDEFKPAVVHFICHGDFDGESATLLLTHAESGRKTAVSEPLTADALLDLLRGQSKTTLLPSVAVLNACHTAEVSSAADRKDAYRGFAASLVEGGIPMVLGMAGEVADGACRVFTCELYQALLEGKSVALATARGRGAALRGYGGYAHTVEWARPTLFVADEAASTLLVATEAAGLTRAAVKFLKLRGPASALCGRLACLEAFELLRQRVVSGSGNRFVLGFGVSEPTEKRDDHKPQFGKTRLLEELAARLALSGIAPVVMSKEMNIPHARNALELTVRLADLMNVTREHFGVGMRPSAAMNFAMLLLKIDGGKSADERLLSEVELYRQLATKETEEIDTEVVRKLLRREFSQLAEDLKGKRVTHVALLLDDLHAYEAAVQPLLDIAGATGLGAPPQLVPLIFTYLRYDAGYGSLISNFMKRHDYQDVTLGSFADAEELLAHRQFLLTRQPQPLAVSSAPDAAPLVPTLYNRLCALTNGVPSRWGTPEFRGALKIYRDDIKVLVDANDEEIVKTYGRDF